MSEDEFEELLNDGVAPVVVFGYEFGAGTVLRGLDPVAFRQAFLDELDILELEEVDDDNV